MMVRINAEIETLRREILFQNIKKMNKPIGKNDKK
jgi:hypothetical protein